MEVALSPELEKLVADQVDNGSYPSPGEVVRDALRLFKAQLELREREHASLQREVQVGLDALEAGDYDEYDAEDMQELASEVKTRGRQKLEEFRKTLKA